MAMSKYNELYRPGLLSLRDGGVHSMQVVRDVIVSALHIMLSIIYI